MKKILTYCLLGVLAMTTTSCEKEQVDTPPQACNSSAKTVKSVVKASGIVHFNTLLMHYVVSVHQPGTADSVDLGIVCGTLPAALQAEGTRVLVTGTFREYGQAPPAPIPAGYTYYYLEIAQLE